MDSVPVRFDGGAEPAESTPKRAPLLFSARLSYTICAFLSMIIQLCLRNSINFVILCMIKKPPPENNSTSVKPIVDDDDNGTLTWSRTEQFHILGVFYYGYLITLPISGILADKFGGKILFVHSITAQALVYMLIPVMAEIGFAAAVVVRVLQGMIAGCGNPALYQLFSVWAHPIERVAFLSFAYGGYSVGAFVVNPISSALCKYGWTVSFYVIGGVSLAFGICCQWLVYSTLEDHPRLSKEEYDYLNANHVEKSKTGVPWKSIFTSVPVYAFIFTHFCHTWGVMVVSLLITRFFKEGMELPLSLTGFASSASFCGSILSKTVTIFSCPFIEQLPNLDLTRFRRIFYVTCNLATISFLVGIILCKVNQVVIVVVLTFLIGIFTDMAFSGAYWPSLLYVAPTFAGLICGIANSFATTSGIIVASIVGLIVKTGTKSEWDILLLTVICSYSIGALIYGIFGSSKLAEWGKVTSNKPATDT